MHQRLTIPRAVFAALLLLVAGALCATDASAANEAYGTFECMGIVADVPGGHTAADVSEARVFIQQGSDWHRIQDAVRVGSQNFFASSAFGLTPGTSYNFKVEWYNNSHALITTTNVSGSTRAEIALPSPTASLYVSPSGCDSAAGTLAAPYATLAKAVSVATAGTHIIMRGGTYYEGDIAMPRSGSSGSPIVIKAYPGETPVLDGADPSLVNTTWTQVAPQVYRHACSLDSRNVTLRRKSDGAVFRAYRMATATEVQNATSVYDGSTRTFAYLSIDAAYCADGANITIRVPSGTIADYDVFVAMRNTGLYFESLHDFAVDGLTFTHFGAGDYNRAIYLNSTSDIVIRNCDFLYNNVGVWVKSASNRVVIEDNTCIDDTADWHLGYTKSAGVLYHGEVETGLVIVTGTYSGRGLVIRRNSINRHFDGSGIAPFGGYTGASTAETDFYDNTLTHVADDFCEIDGYARNYRFFRNYMRESLSGISLAQALDGPTWLVRNRIIDAGICKAIELKASTATLSRPTAARAPKSAAARCSSTTIPPRRPTPARAPCSSSMPPGRGSPSATISGAARRAACSRGRTRSQPSTGTMTTSTARPGRSCSSAARVPRPTTTTTTPRPRCSPRADGSSMAFPPTRSSPTPPRATTRLRSASPCRNAGALLPGINDDFSGTAPDMGAVEFAEAAPSGTYYVSLTGSDSNNGSASAPWRTIQYAVNHIAPAIPSSSSPARTSARASRPPVPPASPRRSKPRPPARSSSTSPAPTPGEIPKG